MKHFHGHNHGLKVTAVEDSGEQICSACELELSGEAYSCAKRNCDFILHKSCSEIPKAYKHKSHPEHTFSLISEPPEHSHYYDCDACGDLIKAFGFQCDECDRRMHVQCAFLPESVECKAHNHNLDLYYSTSDCNEGGCSFFLCDVCTGGLTRGYWVYYCKECDFGTHLDCATSAEAVPQDDEEEESGGDQEDEEEQNGGDQEEGAQDEDGHNLYFHGHSHRLKATALEDSGEQICSVCELELSGEAYSCPKRGCNFILHKSCSELPKTYQHKSHPEHSFSLILEPPEYSLYYNCNACGDLIEAFGFQCDECDRRMHVRCAFLAESVECKAHKHNLDLYYSTSKANEGGYSFFLCDVCAGGVTEGYWSYYCKECDFGTHLDCATSAEAVPQDEEGENQEEGAQGEDEDEEDLPVEVQLERAKIRMEQQRINLDFQMRMARQNAEFMNSLANSWKGLF